MAAPTACFLSKTDNQNCYLKDEIECLQTGTFPIIFSISHIFDMGNTDPGPWQLATGY